MFYEYYEVIKYCLGVINSNKALRMGMIKSIVKPLMNWSLRTVFDHLMILKEWFLIPLMHNISVTLLYHILVQKIL